MDSLSILRTLLHIGLSQDRGRPTVGLIFAVPTEPFAPPSLGWSEYLAGLGLDTQMPLEIIASGDTPAALLAVTQICLWLQRMAGNEVIQARIERYREEGLWEIQIVHEDIETALWAGELATELLTRSTAADASLDLNNEQSACDSIAEFLDFAAVRVQDPSTRLLIRAAEARGLPWINLDQLPFGAINANRLPRHGLLQLGHGHRQHVLLGSMYLPEPTQTLIKSHATTRAELARAGLPIPAGDPENSHINRSSRAKRAAERIGYPVALRPFLHGPLETPALRRPAYGPLLTPEHVTIAYESLATQSREQSVEAFVAGDRQRWIVIGGRVHAAARCTPASVTGDGCSTVAGLIQAEALRQTNRPGAAAWRRMTGNASDLALCLHLQGLSLDSVPTTGKQVALSADCAPHHGGSYADFTDSADPVLAELVLAAARACELSTLCAIDLVVTDTARSQAVVVDVVAGPDLFGHLVQDTGKPRDLAGALLDHWYPDPEQARVPILAVTGTNGKTTTAAMTAAIMGQAGYRTALATTVGVVVDGQWLMRHDLAGITGALMALADPRTEALVVETARGGLIKMGLPFDHCDVAACLNVDDDHIGLDGVGTIDDMARVKRRILEACARAGVINADDPRCLAMRPWISGRRVILVTRDAGQKAVREHLAAGGMAVGLESSGNADWMVLHNGSETMRIAATAEIPATWNGHLRFAVDNAMHAAAMAIGFGIAPECVAEGLRHFVQDPELLPCRMNLVTRFPFTVLLDYAHNPHGLRALSDAVFALPTVGRRILAFGIPDDRTDDTIRAAALAVAHKYDHYFCSGILNSRASDPERAPRLLAEALESAGVLPEQITVIRDPLERIGAVATMARPGDFLVITAGIGTCSKVLPLIEAALADNRAPEA
jgi:cyanophycin synthetase